MNSKLVRPAKVTVDPCWSFVRIIALLLGAWMFFKVMSLQEDTAGAIWEYSVQWQGADVVVIVLVVVEGVVAVEEGVVVVVVVVVIVVFVVVGGAV